MTSQHDLLVVIMSQANPNGRDVLQFAANFERIEYAKTIDNIFNWMVGSFEELRLRNSDLNQVVADGAGNAIGSVAEYERLTRKYRGNDVEIEVCIAHQNERSAGYASGTADIVENLNEELGDTLNKSHKLQTSLSRSNARLNVYRSIAEENGRDPILLPRPGNEIRWNSSVDEAIRTNTIMGDVCETFDVLFGEDG